MPNTRRAQLRTRVHRCKRPHVRPHSFRFSPRLANYCPTRILWPIDADQSTNAIHLSRTLRIAYELLEVRNGVGLGPVYETGVAPAGTLDAVRTELRGVLGRAFGSERGEGEAMRARLGELRGELREAWGEGEGGVARSGVEAFLDSL